MPSYLTIEADDAKKLCGRLEFDASWDKAGPGYYALNQQLKPNLSVGVGGFLAYSYASILAAMAARLVSEDEEAPVDDCAGAIQIRNELLSELAAILDDQEALARLIANEPSLLNGNVSNKAAEQPFCTLLRQNVIANLKVPLNAIIARHFVGARIDVDPAREYRKLVTDLLESWQRKQDEYENEGYRYRLSVLIKDKLSNDDDVISDDMGEQLRNFGFRDVHQIKRLAFAEDVLAIRHHLNEMFLAPSDEFK